MLGSVAGADAAILLKSDDFPTFGLPTIATIGCPISIFLIFLVVYYAQLGYNNRW